MKTTLAKLMLTLLTVALLASCTGTGTNPDQTGDAGTTAATETQTTAVSTESEIDEALEKYSVYPTTTANTDIESLFGTLDRSAKEGTLEDEFVISFTDAEDIAFLVSIGEVSETSRTVFNIDKIFCKDQAVESVIDFRIGRGATEIFVTDEITVIGMTEPGSYYFFDSETNAQIHRGNLKDEAWCVIGLNDNAFTYTLYHPISIQAAGDASTVLTKITDIDQWDSEYGTVKFENGEIVFETKTVTKFSDNGYLQTWFDKIKSGDDVHFAYVEKVREFDTLEDLIEHNKMNAEAGKADGTDENDLQTDDETIYFSPTEDAYSFGNLIAKIQNDAEQYGDIKHISVGKGVLDISFEESQDSNGTHRYCYATALSAYGHTKVFDTSERLDGNFNIVFMQTEDAFVMFKGSYNNAPSPGNSWIFTKEGVYELSPRTYEGPYSSYGSESYYYNETLVIPRYREDGKIGYILFPRKFSFQPVVSFSFCVARDEFARETGYMTFENGQIILHPEKTYTISDVCDLEEEFSIVYSTGTPDELFADHSEIYERYERTTDDMNYTFTNGK